jgi:hypothetical protein
MRRKRKQPKTQKLKSGKAMTDTPQPEVLHGARAIADFLGVSEKAVYHMAERKRIPTFKLGKTLCARRSSILTAMDKLEQRVA